MTNTEIDLASLHGIVQGRVQGVYFRASVQHRAIALHLTGWVRNLSNGAVEVQAEGNRKQLEELLQYLHKGPPAARVEEVTVKWGDYTGDFSTFECTW